MVILTNKVIALNCRYALAVYKIIFLECCLQLYSFANCQKFFLSMGIDRYAFGLYVQIKRRTCFFFFYFPFLKLTNSKGINDTFLIYCVTIFLDIFERLDNFLIFLLLAVFDVAVFHNRTNSSH